MLQIAPGLQTYWRFYSCRIWTYWRSTYWFTNTLFFRNYHLEPKFSPQHSFSGTKLFHSPLHPQCLMWYLAFITCPRIVLEKKLRLSKFNMHQDHLGNLFTMQSQRSPLPGISETSPRAQSNLSVPRITFWEHSTGTEWITKARKYLPSESVLHRCQ